jgi:RNA polymerase sigma factor (sigma-70 family)
MEDALLLQKYAKGQDAGAFDELVRRYAGMVYGTCLRITRNAHDAEDVAQESFLELARRAGAVQNPGPWLYGVAAHKARNVVRDAVTRNRHEEQVMPESPEEPTWEVLSPHIDLAIAELPEELRDVVVQHFLRGQTQAQVAEVLGVNQSTVSRRVDQAVLALREKLRKRGVVASVAVLGALLTQNASGAAVPASLTAALGKMAVAGVGKAGAGVAVGTGNGVLGTVGGKLAVIGAAVAVAVGVGVVATQSGAKPSAPAVKAPAVKAVVPGSAGPAVLAGIETSTSTTGDTNVNKKMTRKADNAKIDMPPPPNTPNVRREGGKAWIEGVPVLRWDKEQCTYAGALAAASMVTEHPCAYDDVMGWSALAFRVRWYQTNQVSGVRGWCPSSPVGEITQAMDATDAATGWRFRHEWHWGNPNLERFAPDIVGAIDGGRPVLAYDSALNVAVICGYADAGRTVLLRQYGGKQELAAVPAAKLGPMLMFFKEHVAPLPAREALVAGLKIAVYNWRRDPEQIAAKGQYWYGATSLRKWAADLADVKGLSEEQMKSLFFVSWWNESSMADARAMAVSFLRRHAGELPGDGQAALLRAADVYEREGRLFRQAFRDRTAFFSPGTGKTIADWTDAVREREAKLLLDVCGIEAEAIGEIEKALAVAGVTESAKGGRIELKIDMPPPPNTPGNTFARGMAAILGYLGTDVSYDRVMGLTGVAFILQVDTSGPYLPGNELDCAWWPNDDWGFELGVPVLAKAVGWDLRKIPSDIDAYKADPVGQYRRAFAPAVELSLRAGKPVLAAGFIGTSLDDQEPPLLGYGTKGKSTQSGQQTTRIGRYPYVLYVVGDRTSVGNAADVDLASLRHIVALYNEQAQGVGAPKTRFSGRQAWAEWLRLMRGGVGHDNNMLVHLRYNRRSAVVYLREMAGRYAGEAATRLTAAADLYQRVLDDLMAAELPYPPGPTKAGPEAYRAMCERVSKLEVEAVAELEGAVKVLTK